MLLRVVHRRWYELNAHHFSHAVRPCKPPCLLHGKVTAQHRKAPYKSAQRLSAVSGKSSLSSVAPEHQRNENSVPFPACASEKNRSLFFRAVSLDRCTESGSGQQNRGRNFVPTLCEGVAFRYSLLHYPVSGCPPELRPESWCRKSRPLFKMLSPAKANRVRILQQYVITHTSLAEPPCISSGFFPERAGRTAQRAAQGFSGAGLR